MFWIPVDDLISRWNCRTISPNPMVAAAIMSKIAATKMSDSASIPKGRTTEPLVMFAVVVAISVANSSVVAWVVAVNAVAVAISVVASVTEVASVTVVTKTVVASVTEVASVTVVASVTAIAFSAFTQLGGKVIMRTILLLMIMKFFQKLKKLS